MATRVLTKAEADKLGLVDKKTSKKGRALRVNPHVSEIMEKAKSTKAGQYVVYEPNDGKSFQTQVLRVRKAFELLAKPWPLTRPIDNGKATAMQVLSKNASFARYPKQPLAKKTAQKAAEPKAAKPAKASKPAKTGRGRRGKKK